MRTLLLGDSGYIILRPSAEWGIIGEKVGEFKKIFRSRE